MHQLLPLASGQLLLPPGWAGSGPEEDVLHGDLLAALPIHQQVINWLWLPKHPVKPETCSASSKTREKGGRRRNRCVFGVSEHTACLRRLQSAWQVASYRLLCFPPGQVQTFRAGKQRLGKRNPPPEGELSNQNRPSKTAQTPTNPLVLRHLAAPASKEK